MSTLYLFYNRSDSPSEEKCQYFLMLDDCIFFKNFIYN